MHKVSASIGAVLHILSSVPFACHDFLAFMSPTSPILFSDITWHFTNGCENMEFAGLAVVH